VPQVFFSYAREELAFAQLAAALLRASGVSVFLDVSSLEYGSDWRTQVKEAISSADKVLLFWSAAASGSRWVLMEVQVAHRLRKIVVPVLLDRHPLPRKLAHVHAVTELGNILNGYMGKPPTQLKKPGTFVSANRPPRPRLEYPFKPGLESLLKRYDVDEFAYQVLGLQSAA